MWPPGTAAVLSEACGCPAGVLNPGAVLRGCCRSPARVLKSGAGTAAVLSWCCRCAELACVLNPDAGAAAVLRGLCAGRTLGPQDSSTEPGCRGCWAQTAWLLLLKGARRTTIRLVRKCR